VLAHAALPVGKFTEIGFKTLQSLVARSKAMQLALQVKLLARPDRLC